jgi:hypothetical protein
VREVDADAQAGVVAELGQAFEQAQVELEGDPSVGVG